MKPCFLACIFMD